MILTTDQFEKIQHVLDLLNQADDQHGLNPVEAEASEELEQILNDLRPQYELDKKPLTDEGGLYLEEVWEAAQELSSVLDDSTVKGRMNEFSFAGNSFWWNLVDEIKKAQADETV